MGREEQIKFITDMIGSKTMTTKGKNLAKNITLSLLVVAFIIGVVGSFDVLKFNMDSYVVFLESFAWFFAPLVLSIGIGSSSKKIGEVLMKKSNNDKEIASINNNVNVAVNSETNVATDIQPPPEK